MCDGASRISGSAGVDSTMPIANRRYHQQTGIFHVMEIGIEPDPKENGTRTGGSKTKKCIELNFELPKLILHI